MDFKQWLTITEETDHDHPDDVHEETVAKYVYDAIEKSLAAFFAKNKKERFSQVFMGLFPNAKMRNTGSTAQPENVLVLYIPDTLDGKPLPKHFVDAGLQVRIKAGSGKTGASYGGGIFDISIDTNVLAQAKDISDSSVQNMLTRFEFQISHEATHISSGKVGSNANAMVNPYVSGSHKRGTKEYNKGKIDYYTDQGELRAHAKQYAVLYKRYFPKQPFDLKNMMSLANHSDKIERYFIGLTDSPAQHVWDMDTTEFKDQLSKAGKFFMTYVKQLVDGKAPAATPATATPATATPANPAATNPVAELKDFADRLIKAAATNTATMGKESAEKIRLAANQVPSLKSWNKWFYDSVLMKVGEKIPLSKYTGMWHDLRDRVDKL